MNFLDSTGLEYFYGKLKEKFIRSVNSYTPDANGNVTITNVATADNLASPDGQTIYDTFIYRTSGGKASISNGEAQLIYIDGNVDIVGRVQENLSIDVENNIQATCDVSVWRTTQLNETGLYNFTYTKPSSGDATSSWNPSIGAWRYNNAIVSLSNYGIECFNVIAPSIVVTTTGANIRNPQVIPNTWLNTYTSDGTYIFTYIGENWTFEQESINLASLGISMSGTVEDGDQIIINYQNGTPNSILTINYIAPERGNILVSTPTAFESTGFNQFDKDSMYIQNASIVNGAIASNSGTYVAYCHAKGGVDNGYVAYSANAYIRNIGWCANLPTIGESVVTTGGSSSGTLASIPFNEDGYVVVVVTNISDLCIHPKWSGTDDTKYEEYVEPDVITLPTTSIDGQTLPLNSYGIPAVGNISDRLNLDAGIYVQNIGRYAYSASNLETVQALGVDYDYDDTNIFYVLNDPIIYSVDVDPIYNVNDFGTEEFLNTSVGIKAYMLYGQNLRDKLRTGVVEKTGDTMSGDLTFSSNSFKNINFQNTAIDIKIDPSAQQTSGAIVFYDKSSVGNRSFGFLSGTQSSTGQTGLTLQANGFNTSGTRTGYSYLRFWVNRDGTPYVYFSHPAAWRSALGAVNKSGDTMTGDLIVEAQMKPEAIEMYPPTSASHGGFIDFHYARNYSVDYTSRIIEQVSGEIRINGVRFKLDHAWKTLTLGSQFEAFASAYTPKYCVIGDICYVSGIVKAKETLPYSSGPYTIGTLPTGARPPQAEIYFVGHGGGQNRFSLQVTSSGVMKIDRYGTTTGIDYAKGAMLAFSCQFPVI